MLVAQLMLMELPSRFQSTTPNISEISDLRSAIKDLRSEIKDLRSKIGDLRSEISRSQVSDLRSQFRFDRFGIPFDWIGNVSKGRGGPPCICGKHCISGSHGKRQKYKKETRLDGFDHSFDSIDYVLVGCGGPPCQRSTKTLFDIPNIVRYK